MGVSAGWGVSRLRRRGQNLVTSGSWQWNFYRYIFPLPPLNLRGMDDPAVSYSVQEGARALDPVARGLFPLSAV